jgi:hypothetical protein
MQSLNANSATDSAFHFRHGAKGKRTLDLLLLPPGSRAEPTAIWSRRFDVAGDRDAVIAGFEERRMDAVFLGRLIMMFGSAALDEVVDTLVVEVRIEREEDIEREAKRARDHFVVNLYARPGKHGRHVLELERKTSSKAEWSVTYDRAIERDRLCDWLRWQKSRFLDFLDHAEQHGDEALARMLIDEMFVTERRVKKEGRGAGGSRPLRMWRGD